MAAKDATTVEVPGPDGAREVRISSPERELWPGTGITKLVLAEYFVSVGPWFMPIVGHRPITLQRFPSGIDGEEFFAKNPPRGVPDYAQTVTLTYPSGRKHPQLVLNELAVAVWAVQMNTITLHPWPVSVTGEAGDTDNPDELRIDLDPQPGRDFHDAAVAALELRRVLADLGLTAYAKTSGNRGVHVACRIEPNWEFPEVRRCALAFAREVERRAPKLVTTAWWKEERGKRVFIDYNQNARDRTIASAYSVRARPDATVSAPVTWDELQEVETEDFTMATMPERFASLGDVQAAIDDSLCDLRRLQEWVQRDEGKGLGEAPYPPNFPKMPGEPPRVQPSRARTKD